MPGEINLGRMLFGQPSAALASIALAAALAAALATSALTTTTSLASLAAATLTTTLATSALVRPHLELLRAHLTQHAVLKKTEVVSSGLTQRGH